MLLRCWKVQTGGLRIFIWKQGLKARGHLTGLFNKSMGGRLVNTGKHGGIIGIIEYYEICKEYRGRYFLQFERI